MQDSMNPDWENALDRFVNVVYTASESKIAKAIIKLANFSKMVPHNVLVRTIPLLSMFLVQVNDGDDSDNNNRRSMNSVVVSVQEAAVYCLKSMAFRDDDGALATEIGKTEFGVLGAILKLLPQAEGRFRRILVECLWCLVDFGVTNRMIVARNGGLEVVVNLLSSCSEVVEKRYLLEILSALALLKEVRRSIVGGRGIRFLVEAVGCGSMRSRERACQAVGLLGVSKRSVKLMLVELGVLPLIVQLFRDGDTKTKLVAGNTLGVISSHVNFSEAGVIPLYAELLLAPGFLGKEIAEDVFCVLAIDEANAVAIAEQLVRILREGDDLAKAAACDVLWDLAGYTHSIPVVRNSGAIPILVEFLSDSNLDLREKASAAIAQLSYKDGDRSALADAGALPILTELLHDEFEVTRDNAAEALVNFAADSQFSLSSEALDTPSFQRMRSQLNQIRAVNGQMVRSTRQMSVEQLTDQDQEFG